MATTEIWICILIRLEEEEYIDICLLLLSGCVLNMLFGGWTPVIFGAASKVVMFIDCQLCY